MQHFYLVENSLSGKLPNAKEMIKEHLTKKGASIIAIDGHLIKEEIPDGTECIIVLGGDGTILKAAAKTIGMNIPIIGINVGKLGYLTSASDEEEIIPMLDKLLNGEYTIEERSMIEGRWEDDEGTHVGYALNDINIARRAGIQTVHMGVSLGGEYLNEYKADGIIVSTPTGSTAYNLSAGGPIVEANTNVMVITPVCPHAFIASSMVVSMNNIAEISIIKRHGSEGMFAEIIFDGSVKGRIDKSVKIKITKSKYSVPLVRLNGDSYFNSLRRKMEELHG